MKVNNNIAKENEYCKKLSPLRLKTPSLNIKVNDILTEALLDTGASVSIISESLVAKESIVVSKRKVFDANRNVVKIMGEIKVKLIVNEGRPLPTVFTENFMVIRENSLDIQLLFGMNILRYAVINFDKGTVTFTDRGSNDDP